MSWTASGIDALAKVATAQDFLLPSSIDSCLEVTVTITKNYPPAFMPVSRTLKSKKENPQTPHRTPRLGFNPCCDATFS